MNLIFIALMAWAGLQLPVQAHSAAAMPTTQSVSVSDAGGNTLPGMKGLKLMTETYTVQEVIAEIPSKVTGTSMIKLVVTDAQELLLERIGKNSTVYVSYILDIGPFNAYINTVKTEWIDANYDTDEDDLVIWWSTGESNNGMQSGFETQRNGVLVINITDMSDLVNFVYVEESRSYSAGPNADTDAEDYHAKMADDSVWETCSYTYEVEMKEGDLFVSKFEKEVEGSAKCEVLQLEEGKYEYDILSGKYERNR